MVSLWPGWIVQLIRTSLAWRTHVRSPVGPLAESHQLEERFFADVPAVLLGQLGQRLRAAAQKKPAVDRAAITPPRCLEQPLVTVAQAEFEAGIFTLIDDDVFLLDVHSGKKLLAAIPYRFPHRFDFLFPDQLRLNAAAKDLATGVFVDFEPVG